VILNSFVRLPSAVSVIRLLNNGNCMTAFALPPREKAGETMPRYIAPSKGDALVEDPKRELISFEAARDEQ